MQIAAIFSLIPAYLKDSNLLLNLYTEINNNMLLQIIMVLIIWFFNILVILNEAMKKPQREFGKVSINLP